VTQPDVSSSGRDGGHESSAALPAADGRWALFLDIDGTLVDHAPTPGAVHVEPRVMQFLDRWPEKHDGALALISGRGLVDIDRLLQPLVLPAAGQHGAERRDAAGRLHRYAAGQDALPRAAARLARLAARHPGLVLEDKGLNLALHYRLAPEMEGEVEGLIKTLARELGDRFELQSGKMVWEIKPRGIDKGTAIAQFMAEPPFIGRTPVFMGDDLTDEFAIVRVNELGGHSIKVGPGPSAARWRLANAAAVRDWLCQLL
jgi:trehalose 6-phosphate phosphatase